MYIASGEFWKMVLSMVIRLRGGFISILPDWKVGYSLEFQYGTMKNYLDWIISIKNEFMHSSTKLWKNMGLFIEKLWKSVVLV